MDDPNDRAHARAPRLEDLVRICRSLNAAGARYLLIGGFAVIAHGGLRTTKDIDFLVDDAPENVARVRIGLEILADKAVRDVADSDVREFTVVRVADEVVVDLMGRACGIAYEEAARDAERIEIEGIEIPVVSKRTLIRTKDTIRPTDAADRRFLEERIAAEGDETSS